MRFLMRLFLVLALVSGTCLADSQGRITADFSEIIAEEANSLEGIKPEDVLLVFDIDNTILATPTNLGSEHWFLWQKELMDAGAAAGAVTTSVEDLLTVQGWIYQVGTMRPVAPEIPAALQNFKKAGFAMIALTSRSLAIRDATLRHLKENGITLSSTGELLLKVPAGAFLPYDHENPEASGLTKAEVEQLNLEPARPAVFEQGLFLTDGQHKGAMLRTLLHRMERPFKKIIFVDDRAKHIAGMVAAFANKPQEVVAFRYTNSLSYIEPFHAATKLLRLLLGVRLRKG